MSEMEVPKGWELITLGDLGEYKYGYNGKATTNKSGKPYLRITDINFNGSLKPERVFVDISDDDFEKYRLENDDLVIARTGATVGKSFLFHGTDDFVFASYLIRYRFDKSKLFSRFLHYVLQSPSFWKFIGLSQSVGAQPNVNATKMSKFEFFLPPLPTQKKIVQKLDHIFGQLEEKKKQIISRIEKFDAKKINENYKNHLLKLAFDGTLTDEKSEIIDGVKVPKEWKIKKFKDFTNVIRGSSPRPKGDSRYFGGEIPWIKISDITASKGKYVFSTKEGLTNEGVLKSRFLKSETLILTTSMLIAMPKILKMDGCIHDGFLAILDIDKEIDTEFLYYYFLAFRGKIEQQSSEGSAIKNINTEVVKNLEIHIPSLETQKKIVAKLDQKFADWENHKQELENIQNQHELIKKHLNSLSSSILNDAFSGKLVN